MPVDCNKLELNVGDKILIPATIIKLTDPSLKVRHEFTVECDIQGYMKWLLFSGNQVQKVVNEVRRIDGGD